MSRCPSRSAIEAATNVTLGWVAALATQVVVFPVMGLQVMLWQSLALTGVFTTMSFLRGYALRRFFIRRSGDGPAPRLPQRKRRSDTGSPSAEVIPGGGRVNLWWSCSGTGGGSQIFTRPQFQPGGGWADSGKGGDICHRADQRRSRRNSSC